MLKVVKDALKSFGRNECGTRAAALAYFTVFALPPLLSLGVLAVLFAALFKFLPDGRVAWRDVWVGGVATALLFLVGKFAIGLYLGHSKPGDAFAAASAFAVVLVWIYYAGMILLFGAEFTAEWARQRGSGIEARDGAVPKATRNQGPVAASPARPIAANTRRPSSKDW